MKLKLNKSKILGCFYLVLLIISFFSLVFSLFDYTHFIGVEKEKDKSIIDRIFNRTYYTVTTLSSANYGDIAPKTRILKVITMIMQLFIILSTMMFFIN